jgi:hypothetical protein
MAHRRSLEMLQPMRARYIRWAQLTYDDGGLRFVDEGASGVSPRSLRLPWPHTILPAIRSFRRQVVCRFRAVSRSK